MDFVSGFHQQFVDFDAWGINVGFSAWRIDVGEPFQESIAQSVNFGHS